MGIDAFGGPFQEQVVGRRLLVGVRLRLTDFADEFLLYTLAVLHNIVDAQFQVAEFEGLGYVAVGAYLQGLGAVFLLGLGSQQDDGEVLVVGVCLEFLCQFQTVHHRHHDIGNDDVKLLLLDNLHCLLSVGGRLNVVFGAEQLVHQHE